MESEISLKIKMIEKFIESSFFDKALTLLRPLLKEPFENVEKMQTYYLYAICLYERNDLEYAQQYLIDAYEIAENENLIDYQSKILYEMALTLYRQGQKQAAINY